MDDTGRQMVDMTNRWIQAIVSISPGGEPDKWVQVANLNNELRGALGLWEDGYDDMALQQMKNCMSQMPPGY
ncbi:hypothetical protein KXS07_07415 [Inquilinus limosus]|uniref:hypothetical protein n=1 Tax=Inquilinus limosus TaxID=171674 RepID=UPI003F188A95